jgi:hypothetical protein
MGVNIMKYPEEFIIRCKNEHPDWSKLHDALSNGEEIVGEYLCGNFQALYIYPDTILRADSLKSLQDRATRYLRREKLYQDWLALYDEQDEDYSEIAYMMSDKLCKELSEEVK